MRWLITGAGGQLGSDLVAVLDRSGGDDVVVAVDRAGLDITDARAVDALVAGSRPDVVVNAAAYTAVDAAETDEDTAHRVNAVGPANLAAALGRHGGRLLHVSTDYVFAGDADRPYEPEDPTGPRSAYGRTKLAGEQAVLALLPEQAHVVRTAWVYGARGGGNFVKTMARLERERDTVSVVDDQVGSPTWSADLAAGLVELGRAGAVTPGILHATNSGPTSWFGLTQAIFEELGADPARVQPTSSAEFVRSAPRPAYSVLSPRAWTAAGLAPLRPWREALAAAFATAGHELRGSAGPRRSVQNNAS
ncbi:MAG: dTDP-4-dehydrorhamnose reductase [bacterium]